MKVVRDPVHGYIELDELALRLIDTPQVQRLRRIRQLGLSNMVYPGANHTRFEHSLGTMHLANSMKHNVYDDTVSDNLDELSAAALLHDVGHPPFSHVTEDIIKKYTGKGHEDVRNILRHSPVAEILDDCSIDVSNVEKHIKGATPIGQILSSEIDVDRMDYLVRDAHYTGVPHITDTVRLIHEMKFFENKLVVNSGGLRAAESLLLARFLMHPTVYYHHVSRIAETMYVHAVEYMIDNDDADSVLNPNDLRFMDDYQIMAKLSASQGYPNEIYTRLNERRMFKRAIYVGFDLVGENVLKLRGKEHRLRREIAESAGIDEGYVLVDIPKKPVIPEMKAKVMINGEMKRLDEASTLVNSLESAHVMSWRMGVYTLPEYKEKVRKIAKDVFSVKKTTTQYKLDDVIA